MKRKGILLAGGRGTRLYPATRAINKHLLPVYDKPMIYYPLSVLMLANIDEVILISTPEQLPLYRSLFDGCERLGLTIHFREQPNARGIADALLIAEESLAGAPSTLILGDNLLFGMGLTNTLKHAAEAEGATIFAYPVSNPCRFGVVELDNAGCATALTEKPIAPKSRLAVPGLYFYDHVAPTYARSLKESNRGELEITDLNRIYLEQHRLSVRQLGRGTAWLDTGTWESYLDACNFVAAIERRQGLKIGCIEEVAWRNKWIDDAGMREIVQRMPPGEYRTYILDLLEYGSEG